MLGMITSVAEVTHVSKHGFWLLLDTEELLVSFEHFPWFKKATIEQRLGRPVANAEPPLLASTRYRSFSGIHSRSLGVPLNF